MNKKQVTDPCSNPYCTGCMIITHHYIQFILYILGVPGTKGDVGFPGIGLQGWEGQKVNFIYCQIKKN